MATAPTGREPRQIISPETVRDALENLYANVALANSALAVSGLFVAPEAGAMGRAQVLRHRLLRAIEELRPLRPSGSTDQSERRSYEILTLRYVAGYTVPEVADQLSLGTRQVYRDLRRGEEEMAAMLTAQFTSTSGVSLPDASGLQQEIDAPTGTHQTVDLVAALRDALVVLQPLVNQKGLTLDFPGAAQAAWVPLAPGVARQVLIQFLSAVIQQGSAGERLALQVTHQALHMEIRVRLSRCRLDPQNDLLSEAVRTARSLGLSLLMLDARQGELVLSVSTLSLQPVLVVEDNPGARVLYERYLEGSRWRVVAVKQLSEVAEIAVSLRPVAVILDILMAEVDGWTVLQVLKSDPRIARVPVIVCSVISDPELARALGASASLAKPLSRLDLLEALERVTTSHSVA